LKDSVNMASELQETQSKFETVFGKTSRDAERWVKKMSGTWGRSKLDLKTYMADSQDLMTGFGMKTAKANEFSKRMTAMAIDLASFGNKNEQDAVDAFRKGIMGEHENLKALGIIINETILKKELLARKDRRKLKTLTQVEKMELRMAIAVKQSKNAVGDAEKTAGSYANQLRRYQGISKDVKASFGRTLLPVLTRLMKGFSKIGSYLERHMPQIKAAVTPVINKVAALSIGLYHGIGKTIAFVNKHATKFKVVLGVLSYIIAVNTYRIVLMKVAMLAYFIITKAITAATWVYNGVMFAVKAATLAWTVAQWGLNAAMSANPIGLVIVGIAALIGASYLIYKNWNRVKALFLKYWKVLAIGAAIFAPMFLPLILVAKLIISKWKPIKAFFIGLWEKMKPVIAGIKKFGKMMGLVDEGPQKSDLTESDKIVKAGIRKVAVSGASISSAASPIKQKTEAAMSVQPKATKIDINYNPEIKVDGGRPEDFKKLLMQHKDDIADMIEQKAGRKTALSY